MGRWRRVAERRGARSALAEKAEIVSGSIRLRGLNIFRVQIQQQSSDHGLSVAYSSKGLHPPTGEIDRGLSACCLRPVPRAARIEQHSRAVNKSTHCGTPLAHSLAALSSCGP